MYNLCLTQEDSLKTLWQVRRITVAQHDGERRWDYAYQFLRRWTMERTAGAWPAPVHHQEETPRRRSRRPCSTSRQQQPQTIEQQRSRLRAYVATQPEWHIADEQI